MLLKVDHLNVIFPTPQGPLHAVRNLSFSLSAGETVGIVGESGCGKSITAQTIKGLIKKEFITSGSIHFDGYNLLELTDKKRRSLLGKEIGMVFQDPMTSLNPTMRIGKQIVEAAIKYQKLGRAQAEHLAIDLLKQVGIHDAARRVNHYPHEFSGGMRQRVVFAMAIALNPKLLIADEPTTALDVTIQAQLIALMKKSQKIRGTTTLFITHDLALVAGLCDRVMVMYGGQIVESAPVEQLYSAPQHPYTQGLLNSVFRLDMDRSQKLSTIVGSPPHLLDMSEGCLFHKRCPHAMRICKQRIPSLDPCGEKRSAACWLLKRGVLNDKAVN